MKLNEIEPRLSKMSREVGFLYSIGLGANEEKIQLTEDRLHLQMPSQVKLFYENNDGLEVRNPMLTIFDLERLSIHREARLHFAVFGDGNNVYEMVK